MAISKLPNTIGSAYRSIPYCTSLSALQTAIQNIVNTMGDLSTVCGFANTGFSDPAKGISGSKSSFILARQSADVFVIHLFSGWSTAIGYYYSSSWHWATPANYIENVAINMDSSKLFIRDWGKFTARKTGGMLSIIAHGVVAKQVIANETAVATCPSLSNVPAASCAVKVDGQTEPGIAMFAGNTLRLINIQHADYALYFTLTMPLS